jgi:hydroxypyruvate reductase
MKLRSEKPVIYVIANVPEALRLALTSEAELEMSVLEGQDDLSAMPPPDCRIILTRAIFGVPPVILDHLPKLELVLSLGAGLEKIDVTDLQRRGIAMVHTPDELTEDVADYAVGLVYATQRNIVAADRFVRSGNWSQGRFGYSRRISSRRVGIVGMGRIGSRIATKLEALGIAVAYFDPSPSQSFIYPRFGTVTELAESVDILVLACGGTDGTRHLVSKQVIAKLGANGIVVNVSRGSVIDEDSLLEALETKQIAGAALDVFSDEPSINPRFIKLSNVILSPHAASLTEEAKTDLNNRLIRGLRDYCASVTVTKAN